MTEGMGNWQGWLYVAAVLIPLGAFVIEILGGRWLGKLNAYLATLAIGSSFVLSAIGLVSYVANAPEIFAQHHATADEPGHATGAHSPEQEAAHGPLAWTGSFNWVALGGGLRGAEAGPRDAGPTPPLVIPIGIYIDNLAVIMFAMVTFIATLIHLYSIGYMEGDVRYPRFFAYLSLFCFSMLGLVASASVFMIFIFWELVGVCSYLLIGHWYEDKKNADAANKAFVVNRVGDIGMLVGLGILWSSLGTFNIHDINRSLGNDRLRDPVHHRLTVEGAGETVEVSLPDYGQPGAPDRTHRIPYWLLCVAGLGIFGGCMGKSAQFPLHVWLPDAMAGPTPVSALIHAATMVAAGVYLVGRFFPLFTNEVLIYIAYTGGITLFIAASIAIVQTDYKKVLAYSTVSQLGYMMLALGVGGWAAGLFHLLTHAFFKALLFLGAGSVYHAVHTYEMFGLGGLRKKMPITCWTMFAATLAISGVPPFSGFFSKDAILASSLFYVEYHPIHALLFALPAVGAAMTAFYMFRMWFLLFVGEPRTVEAAAHDHGHAPAHGHDDHGHAGHPVDHAHESPPIMSWPLIALAIPTVLIGLPITIVPFLGYEPILEGMLAYGEPVRAVDILVSDKLLALGASFLVAFIGIGLGFLAYGPLEAWRKVDPRRMAARFGGAYSLLSHKWYFDELYNLVFVQGVLTLSRWASEFDRRVIDGIVDGSANITVLVSKAEGWFDNYVVDKIVNLVGWLTYLLGDWGRLIQTGRLRNYLMVLALAVVGLFVGVFAWIRGA